MKPCLPLACLLLCLFFAGCTTTTVDYDYDTGFDFSQLSTYAWVEVPKNFPAGDITINRIKRAVDQQMELKGFSRTEASPDFLISIQGFVDIVRQGVVSPDAYRGYRGYDRFYTQTVQVYEYQEGTLSLTMINADKTKVIWTGNATRVLNPETSVETKERVTNEVVAKLLENFPPVGKQ